MTIYFIDKNSLAQYGFTHGNINSDLINPCILRVQDRFISDSLGTSLFKRVADYIVQANGDSPVVNEDIVELLNDYIRPLLTALVESRLTLHQNNQIRAKGVGNSLDTLFSAKPNSELKMLLDELDKDAIAYEKRLRAFLCDNLDKFPEYEDPAVLHSDKTPKKSNWKISVLRRNKS